jgi:hypothetical protein
MTINNTEHFKVKNALKMSKYFVTIITLLKLISERSPPQLVPAQMLHESGEREGRRLDGGRQRVLSTTSGQRKLDFGLGIADTHSSNAIFD